MSRSQIRAVRGATTVARDTATLVCDATRELLTELLTRNGVAVGDVICATFTVTHDLRSAFPARAARELGWSDVPMLCATEINVPGSLPRCLRVMLLVERPDSSGTLAPAYLHNARALRCDSASGGDEDSARTSQAGFHSSPFVDDVV
jgi:chorismate mutase